MLEVGFCCVVLKAFCVRCYNILLRAGRLQDDKNWEAKKSYRISLSCLYFDCKKSDFNFVSEDLSAGRIESEIRKIAFFCLVEHLLTTRCVVLDGE